MYLSGDFRKEIVANPSFFRSEGQVAAYEVSPSPLPLSSHKGGGDFSKKFYLNKEEFLRTSV